MFWKCHVCCLQMYKYQFMVIQYFYNRSEYLEARHAYGMAIQWWRWDQCILHPVIREAMGFQTHRLGSVHIFRRFKPQYYQDFNLHSLHICFVSSQSRSSNNHEYGSLVSSRDKPHSGLWLAQTNLNIKRVFELAKRNSQFESFGWTREVHMKQMRLDQMCAIQISKFTVVLVVERSARAVLHVADAWHSLQNFETICSFQKMQANQNSLSSSEYTTHEKLRFKTELWARFSITHYDDL